jgi:micrococcal nuclease
MYEYQAKIIRVVDGDSIIVDIDLGFNVTLAKQSVRLYGVDTPETRTKNPLEKKCGLLVKEYVQSLLKANQIYTMKTHLDKKGKFGRILADFRINTVFLSELLITKGYAVKYTGQSKELVRAAHIANQQRLINEGLIIIDG